jgi:putative chitinase
MTRQQLLTLAPRARTEYRDAFAGVDTILDRYAINATALRLAHFMAQGLHESGLLTILQESMNYAATALTSLFRTNRITAAQATQLGRTADHPADQRALANTLYGGSWGLINLGNSDPDDGWNFRGAGLLQMTGRDSRTRIGARLGIDLVGSPDLAIDPRYILPIACEEWTEKGCNALADNDDVRGVTKKINGGTIGLDDRTAQLGRMKALLGVS